MIATVSGKACANYPCHFLKRRSQVCHSDCLVDDALNLSRSCSSIAFLLVSSSSAAASAASMLPRTDLRTAGASERAASARFCCPELAAIAEEHIVEEEGALANEEVAKAVTVGGILTNEEGAEEGTGVARQGDEVAARRRSARAFNR